MTRKTHPALLSIPERRRAIDDFERQQADVSDAAPGAPVDPDTQDREAEVDRRSGLDRRSGAARGSEYDRRRGPGRRRTDYRRAAEDGHMNEEQLEFLKAISEYRRANDRPFPTWTEVLDVLLYLGYRKVAPLGEFRLCKGRQTPVRQAKPKANPRGAE